MIFIYGWLILTILSTPYSYIEGASFLVSTYGAHPNDDIDDTQATQLAINMAIENGSNNIVEFGSGTYIFTSTINIFNCVNLTIMGQGMNETLLIGTTPATIFSADVCQGLKITSLATDFDPFPFTAGYVVSVNETYLDIEIKAPHRADIDRQVQAILRYDPVHMRPAFGPNTYEIYQTPPSNVNTSLISPGILRIPLASPSQFTVGDAIVARYAFANHAIYGQDVTDFTIQSITTYTSWAMGLVALRARRLNINDYHVKPRDHRWMSTAMDCMHFMDSREFVNISDSECEAMGDDGLNVLTFYFNVTKIINSSALVLQTKYSSDLFNFGLGTRLEFSANQQPFTVYTTAIIASSSVIGPNSQLFMFTSPINATVGDWVCVADTPSLIIRNFTVANNRARGALLETRNIHLSKSLFNRTSGPAILFQPSLYWLEGPGARNVTLSENLYINCNEGITQESGIITILPDPTQLVPVIYDIQIESSTFLTGTYSQGILQSTNGVNVSISGNYIATNSSTPFISICNSRNISAHNNTVVNTQTTINQYYTYDNTNPCQRNLSSLIDLPASAFNSSFPPPVMLTKFS
jgi:hypothetical protein